MPRPLGGVIYLRISFFYWIRYNSEYILYKYPHIPTACGAQKDSVGSMGRCSRTGPFLFWLKY